MTSSALETAPVTAACVYVCAASRSITGAACDEPTSAGRFPTREECVVNRNVLRCDTLGIFACATTANCGGVLTSCEEVVPLLCDAGQPCLLRPRQRFARHLYCVRWRCAMRLQQELPRRRLLR
eukprot:Mycagemm_TRINITY_DN10287_c1_g3::TRINITY_DN10287_c1_g3_i1::g.3695::m.3695 type:complete len:124 gc:universal TRINITY_DN10287_c1_g3_i1:113-484(+)